VTDTAKETYESLNIEPKPIRPHILAAATVVFGDDYYGGRRETINLSGFVQMNKWPMPGFQHRVAEDGTASFDLELISAPEVGIKGFSYTLNDRIQILSNPLLPNTGHIKQIVPGKNFPAEFYIRRFGILETSTMRLTHRGVIDVMGIADGIPPFKTPLTSPFLGRPYGDGPGEVMPAHNVVRGTNLPAAWYPSTDDNQAIGNTPSAFFASSMGPCVSMLVDPSIIIQASTEAKIKVEVNGRTEEIELSGDYPLAAGAEILLFGPEKHDQGSGVLAQLARVALVGECPGLGGKVMLRASFFAVSGGQLGDGNEDSLSRLRYPGELHFDAQFELLTPEATLYAASPVHLSGQLKDLEPNGTVLTADHADAALRTEDGTSRARLTGVTLKLGDALVGAEAYVSA
jgi:hypothetical protein